MPHKVPFYVVRSKNSQESPAREMDDGFCIAMTLIDVQGNYKPLDLAAISKKPFLHPGSYNKFAHWRTGNDDWPIGEILYIELRVSNLGKSQLWTFSQIDVCDVSRLFNFAFEFDVTMRRGDGVRLIRTCAIHMNLGDSIREKLVKHGMAPTLAPIQVMFSKSGGYVNPVFPGPSLVYGHILYTAPMYPKIDPFYFKIDPVELSTNPDRIEVQTTGDGADTVEKIETTPAADLKKAISKIPVPIRNTKKASSSKKKEKEKDGKPNNPPPQQHKPIGKPAKNDKI